MFPQNTPEKQDTAEMEVFSTSSLHLSSWPRASERNPEAITNLEHLFMQLIFFKGKKAKKKKNNKKNS